jgi:hypothetical protein
MAVAVGASSSELQKFCEVDGVPHGRSMVHDYTQPRLRAQMANGIPDTRLSTMLSAKHEFYQMHEYSSN